MSLDVMTLGLKAMGVDPGGLMAQAQALGAAFERMARSHEMTVQRLDTLLAQQTAIAAALGVAVGPPDAETVAAIGAASLAYVRRHGGPVDVGLDGHTHQWHDTADGPTCAVCLTVRPMLASVG